VGPRNGLDTVAKRKLTLSLPGIEPRSSSPDPGRCTDRDAPAPISLLETLFFNFMCCSCEHSSEPSRSIKGGET
jgi:hypothetical protein